MKSIIIIFTAILFTLNFSSCGNRNAGRQGAHVHGDDCGHDHTAEPVIASQESFRAEADSVHVEHDHDHSHSHDGHTH